MLIGRETIRDEIIDDCALARRVKSVGRVWLATAGSTVSIREYGSWRAIWDMIARCAFAQLGYAAPVLVGTVAGMALIYLAPPLLLPLAALFYTAATIGSAIQYWRGRGGNWKGRFQAAPVR